VSTGRGSAECMPCSWAPEQRQCYCLPLQRGRHRRSWHKHSDCRGRGTRLVGGCQSDVQRRTKLCHIRSGNELQRQRLDGHHELRSLTTNRNKCAGNMLKTDRTNDISCGVDGQLGSMRRYIAIRTNENEFRFLNTQIVW
jgi:hypothetical protein